MRRPIIEIDEERCNGCGKCILDCAEGALAIVNGKAKLISDVYCDGLGACLNCPQGALSLKEREAPPFDEAAAMEAKLEREQAGGGAPLEPLRPIRPMAEILADSKREARLEEELKPALRAWPLQLELMPPKADYYQGAELLLSAQCAGFALPDIHRDWIKGRLPIIACPKLENHEKLVDRLAAILANNDVRGITVLRMSVPCCGLEKIVRKAIEKSGKDVPWQTHVVRLN